MKLRLAPLQGTTRGFPAPTRQCHLCHLRAHSVQVTFAVLPKFTQMRHEAGTYRWWRYPMGEPMGKISRGWCVKCGQREFLKRCVLKLHLEAMLRRCPKWPAKFPVGTHDHVGSVTWGYPSGVPRGKISRRCAPKCGRGEFLKMPLLLLEKLNTARLERAAKNPPIARFMCNLPRLQPTVCGLPRENCSRPAAQTWPPATFFLPAKTPPKASGPLSMQTAATRFALTRPPSAWQRRRRRHPDAGLIRTATPSSTGI